jgi:hypothetical protein
MQNAYDLYLPQIVIDERLKQKYRDLKAEYQKLDEFTKNFSHLADITTKCTIDEKHNDNVNDWKSRILPLFGEKIIPFVPSAEIAKHLWLRALDEISPYRRKDKDLTGVKDTILWLSLIEFFRTHRYTTVLFASTDTDFVKNHNFLSEEFESQTKCRLQIINGSDLEEMATDVNLESNEPPMIGSPDGLISSLGGENNDR